MPNLVQQVGYATRVTVTGIGTLSPGNYVGLVGVHIATGTSQSTVRFWHGTATGNPIIGPTTMTMNAFYPVPGLCSGGCTYYVTGVENPDLTIYWNPAG